MIKHIKYQTHAEWLQIRHNYIGGSDAAASIGMDNYKSPYSLWAEKTGRAQPFEGNITTRVGSYLEELVAKLFCEETGKRVRRRRFTYVNLEYPFACANIDREIIGEKALLEIKTTNSFPVMRQCRGEDFPDRWYCQMMHYMAVTGLEKAYLAVLINCREFKVFGLERDEAEITALMDAEKAFWQYVDNDTPPPVDGSTATAQALDEAYPQSTDMLVDLTAYIKELDLIAECTERIKELEVEKNEATAKIKAFMGEAEKGYCGEEYVVLWKSQLRKTFDAKRLQADNPKTDFSRYYKTSESRVFKISLAKKQ